MTINLCWWNLGISPPISKQKQNKDKTISLAKSYILKFAEDHVIDFFAFCEISSDESHHLEEVARMLEMEYLDLYGKDGRMIFDFAIMYESSKLEHIPKYNKNLSITNPDGTKIRVGVRVSFKDLKTNKLVTFILSHWPSNLMDNREKREYAAISVREIINKIFEQYTSNAQIICMGDYNDHPYSKPIHDRLFSTKDFHQVRKKPKLLFNPFWSLLSDGGTNNIGTYHYKNTSGSDRWFVFDQMIFSSSFICDEEDLLKLNFGKSSTYRIFNSDNTVADSIFLENFDHSPIFCEVYHG
ncbi:endonuclease/exonuclease/phosphatase family protein (plasmid) [Edwardsiella tarda]|nr:endonuclease [Edwardsiella tarda]UCQ19561.1 endonuclease/exonuclease/phosphatase family protein [Edwardsiella tarda]